MKIDEKIEKLLQELNEVLQLLNQSHERSTDADEKEDIRKVIEIHISYVVFLKELEIELKDKPEKKFTKEFLVKQFANIQSSCKLVRSEL